MHHMQKWIRDRNLRTKIIRCLQDMRNMRNENLTCTQSVHSYSIHNMQKAETIQYQQPNRQAKKYIIST